MERLGQSLLFSGNGRPFSYVLQPGVTEDRNGNHLNESMQGLYR